MLVEFGRSSCLLHIRQMLSTQCIIVRIRWLLQLLRQWAIRSDHSASEWYIALRQQFSPTKGAMTTLLANLFAAAAICFLLDVQG